MRKRPTRGVIVSVLEETRTDRGMRLIEFQSRCVPRGEIHELVTTDEADLGAGRRLDRVGFVGFAEIDTGGVIESGDEVLIGDRRVGRVAGFDDCHWPNHYNVIIAADALLSGRDLGIRPEERVEFVS